MAMKTTKKKYTTSAHKNLTQKDWLELFKKIQEVRNITEVANGAGIRRQILSEKYNLWKKYGDNYVFSKTWSNRIFTQEEENELFRMIWNYDGLLDKEQRFSDTVIERVASSYYHMIQHGRKVKPFKVSLGWIIDFRHRFGIKFKSNKSYYLQWEIISPHYYDNQWKY